MLTLHSNKECNPIICNYKMGGKVLSRVKAQRDLEVLISDTASFSNHVHIQVNKANKLLHFICPTISRSKILFPTLISLYVTLVHHLQFTSEIRSPKSVIVITRIEGVQQFATRLMLPNFCYNEHLKRLNLLPLVYHREIKDL